jgi:hypothetical protein
MTIQERFWCLRGSDSSARLADWAKDEVDTEKIICPIYPGHQRQGRRLSDLSLVLPRHTVEDFVWQWGSGCLIQDRVLELFKGSGFTGFEVKSARARFKRPNGWPPRLWEFVVTGWAGMAACESGIRLANSCEACGSLDYSACENSGALIDARQWDGSDFFMVWPLPLFIFVTDRVAQLIFDSRLTGAVLKKPEELDLSGDGFGPGRLSHWMPEKRAHELGDKLGIY